jgi:hypothetical protein
MANRALDAVELQLDSGDPKASLDAARFILQGTRLLGDSDLPRSGPTTPEAVIMAKCEVRPGAELQSNKRRTCQDMGLLDPFGNGEG